MRPILIVTTALAIAALSSACGSSSPDVTPAGVPSIVLTPAAQATIQPVPGSNKNKYIAGPFTVTLIQGIATEPNGTDSGTELLVENTSNNFTGYANPEVQYTLNNEVIGTSNNTSASLAPGQKQTLWVNVVADRDVRGQYVDAQLIDCWFGVSRSEPGTRLQFAH